MNPSSILERFTRYVSGLESLSPRSRALLCEQAKVSLGDGELDGADGDVFKEELHFQQLRAVVGKMQWDALSHEEKITFFYPGARKVGESVKLAKGTGKVIRREVTIRFGLEMAFRMEDGSIFGGEFFD